MYVPESLRVDDEAEVEAFLARHNFATLVSASPAGMFATHVPITVRRREKGLVLVGHVARANPHWEGMNGADEWLAIFTGPHGYISPTWYATAPAVPTWNYGAVHAYGKARAVEDPSFTREAVRELVARHEPGPGGWRMEDQPPGFIDGLLRAIVAFEMPIDRFEAKLKLGQNRSAADRSGVLAALEREGSPEAAALAAFIRAAVIP